MNKGYTQADIIREFTKLEEAGVSYRIIISAVWRVLANAALKKTAAVLNQFHPRMMILTQLPSCQERNYTMNCSKGIFIEPSELEPLKSSGR